MERLIVTAFLDDIITSTDKREPNYVLASVMNDDGVPIKGLRILNFKVDPIIFGTGGSRVNVTDVTAADLPGFYHINVTPVRKDSWKEGVYLFAVAVMNETAKGQTLTTIKMG